MTRSELLKAAESRLGQRVPQHVLDYARRVGAITMKPGLRKGWKQYADKAVDQLVDFVVTRSRSTLPPLTTNKK
jgi:hypothetical protein